MNLETAQVRNVALFFEFDTCCITPTCVGAILDKAQQPRLPPSIGHLPGDVTPAGARQHVVTTCHVMAAITLSCTINASFHSAFNFVPCFSTDDCVICGSGILLSAYLTLQIMELCRRYNWLCASDSVMCGGGGNLTARLTHSLLTFTLDDSSR